MSSEIGRLESLLGKMVHPLASARLAAAKSLLFKLESNLFGDISRSVSCVKLLNDAMVEALSLILSSDDWKQPGNPEADILSTLCQTFQKISTTFDGSAYASGGDFSKALGMLQRVASLKSSDGMVEKTIEALCTISITSKAAGHVAVPSANEEAVKDMRPVHNKGAGAVLQSAQCHEGWKFPAVVLTSVDEHHMADVEVKIKLGHDTARSLLYATLADFPIPAIMENISLIRAVLDVVGGSHSHGVASNGKGLDSTAAMAWLEKLLSGAVAAHSVYLDGSLCSYNSDENAPIDEDEPQSGLATNITSAIARMRFPAVGDSARPGQGLSISGLAFACAAASMPLLSTSDPELLCSCLSLLQTSIPLLKEPTEPTDRKTRVETMRLQHLFNRIDGLLDSDQGYACNLVAVTAALRDGDDQALPTKCLGLLSLLTKLLAMIPAGCVYPYNVTMAKTQATKISLCPNTIAAVRELCVHSKTVSPLFAAEKEINAVWAVLKTLDPRAYDSILRAQDLVMCAKSMQYASYSEPVDVLLEKLGSSIQILETVVPNTEPGAPLEDYNCIEYTLGLYLAMAASGSDVRDLAFQQSMDLVARILTHSTPTYRMMCLKKLRGLMDGYLPEWTCELFINFGITGDKLLAIEVQQMLLQPWLVEAIVMGSVYVVNVGEEDLGQTDRVALGDAAFDLLGSLLVSLGEEHTSRIFQVAPAEWSRLLFPLTLLEWGVDGMDFEFIPQSIFSFRNLLELFCYSSDSNSIAKNAYYMISVYGLFHSSAIVRRRSASLLGSAENYDWDGRTIYNPWHTLAASQRKKEKFAGRSPEYHSSVDVGKIARLAFGPSSHTANFAALRQLRSICADLNPAPTSEPDWCVSVGASAMDEITSFYYQVRDNEVMGVYEDRDLQACVESLLIVRSLVSKCTRVRADVDIKLQSTDSDIPFAMLLDLACIPEGDAEHSEMVATVQILSKQLLALFAVDKVSSEGMAGATMGTSLEAGRMGYSILNVSRDLSHTFSFPELNTEKDEDGRCASAGEYSTQVSAKDAMDGLVFIDLSRLRYSQGSYGGGVVSVSPQDLDRVKTGAAQPPVDTLLHDFTDAFARQIAQADDTSTFVAAMDTSRALMATIPISALFFARKDLDVVLRRTADSPRNAEEVAGIAKSVQFLTSVLKSTHLVMGASACDEDVSQAKSGSGAVKDLIVKEVMERGENGELGYLYESVAKCIRTSLPSLAYDSSAAVPMADSEVIEFKTLKGSVLSPRHKPEAVIAAHKESALYLLVSLHHALLSHAATSTASKELLSTDSVLEILQELAFDKGKDPWLRRAVLEVLHTGFAVSSQFAGGTFSPRTAKWKVLIDTARVLRKPDSFQGFGVLLSSMKAISKGLSSGALGVDDFCDGDESTEPKWLVRLLYDRRAEVRLVALECVTCVPSFRHSRALGEVLVALAADGSECPAVTHCALKILLNATFGETRSRIIGEFLCKAEEALNTAKPTVSISSISFALSALLKLILSPSSRASALAIVESLQLMPLLMRIASESFQETVTKLAHSRLGVSLTTMGVSAASQGWVDALQYSTGVQARLAWATCRICGFRTLLALEQESPKAFQQCAAKCKFADSLVACIASPAYDSIVVPPAAKADKHWLAVNEAESRCFASLCEIMSVTLSTIEEKSVLRRYASILCEALPTCVLVQAGRVGVVALSWDTAARAELCRATLAPLLRLVCLTLDTVPSATVDGAVFMEALIELKGSIEALSSPKPQAEFSRVNSQITVAMAMLLQNTDATMAPELLQGYFLRVSASVKALQDALEVDAARATKHSHAAGNSPSTKADTTGLRRIIYTLWSSLLVVKSSFYHHSPIARGLAEFSGLHEGIDVLLSRCVKLSESSGVHGGRALLALLADHPSSEGGWTPNFSHLCSASLAVWCSLCAGHTASKGLMLKGVTLAGGEGRYKSNNLTHVTTLGTSSSVAPAVNQISLALLSSAMSCAFSGRDKASDKTTPVISRIAAQTSMAELYSSLQETLKKGQREDVSGTVALLIDAIGSCAALEGIQGEIKAKAVSPGGGLRSQSPTMVRQKGRFDSSSSSSSSSSASPAESSLDPALLSSIMNDYKTDSSITNAIVRFLGKQAATKMFLLDGCDDLLSRRLLSKANSVECMSILTDNMKASHPVNTEMTSIVLWTLIHSSEQARANFKQNVAPATLENQLNGANGRAKFGLRNLLAR